MSDDGHQGYFPPCRVEEGPAQRQQAGIARPAAERLATDWLMAASDAITGTDRNLPATEQQR